MKTLGSAALVALVALVPAAAADEPAESGSLLAYRVPAGETRVGDAYLFATTVAIDGTHRGDLVGWAQSIRVGGTVTGDLVAGAQSVSVDGTLGDSARVFAQSVTVNGTVNGNLLVFAATLVLGPNARVTGDLKAFVQSASLQGAVEGAVSATGGEVTLAGPVGGSATIRAENLIVAPSARIAGDLDYASRRETALPGSDVVKGEVRYEELRSEEEEEEAEPSRGGGGSLFWWGAKVLAAFLVGLVGVLLFPRASREIATAVGRDWAGGLGIGFITAIVVPVAAVLVALALVTIPLSVVALLLYLVAIYVAKLAVALWAGGRILAALRRSAPSHVASLAVGVPLLYAAFELPFVGWIAWVACLCLGLGAIILGTRSHLRQRGAVAAGA